MDCYCSSSPRLGALTSFAAIWTSAEDAAPLVMDMPLHDPENAAAVDPLDVPLPVDVADVIS